MNISINFKSEQISKQGCLQLALVSVVQSMMPLDTLKMQLIEYAF